MEKLLFDQLLYDFYSSLLTKKQSQILSLYYEEDLGLAEIAQREGISRQAVYDIIKRALNTLNGYEKKLHLVEKDRRDQENLQRVKDLLNSITNISSKDQIKETVNKCINYLKKIES